MQCEYQRKLKLYYYSNLDSGDTIYNRDYGKSNSKCAFLGVISDFLFFHVPQAVWFYHYNYPGSTASQLTIIVQVQIFVGLKVTGSKTLCLPILLLSWHNIICININCHSVIAHFLVLFKVRSSDCQVGSDLKHYIGFLSNPKRFNVAISRAQALLVVIGNPILLANVSSSLSWVS